jgi:hypothetical protein
MTHLPDWLNENRTFLIELKFQFEHASTETARELERLVQLYPGITAVFEHRHIPVIFPAKISLYDQCRFRTCTRSPAMGYVYGENHASQCSPPRGFDI